MKTIQQDDVSEIPDLIYVKPDVSKVSETETTEDPPKVKDIIFETASLPVPNDHNITTQGFLVKYRLPIIIIGSCFSGVASIAVIVLVIVIVRRRRKRREENSVAKGDLNPVYGVYYSGEADYSIVTDTNALYEREGGEDGHNIVRDNNSNYGDTD